MCLAVPMQVKRIDGLVVYCEARGIEREASLLMYQHDEIRVGDHVMIQLGHVIQRMSAEEAQQSWALYDEIFAQMETDSPAGN